MSDVITLSNDYLIKIEGSMNKLVGKATREIIIKIFEILSSQLKQENSYIKMNESLVILRNLYNITFDDYTSENEVNVMFENAFMNGEYNLNNRDRVILRFIFIAAGSVYITSELLKSYIQSSSYERVISLRYSDINTGEYENAKLVFDTLNNKSRREVLSIGSDIIISYLQLFDRIGDPTISSNLLNIFNSQMKTSHDADFASKTILIGPAYIIWLAVKKWNIDWDWNPNLRSSS